jgi:hypothetical protein
MSFRNAVLGTPSIAASYQNGLRALGAYSAKIAPANTRKCEGSVDLDACLRAGDPQGSRWDYAIGYEGLAYFAEVHSASGQVSKVIDKVNWLRNWLRNDGARLAAIHYPGGNFHWIPIGGVNILGKERLRLAQDKIVIKSRLSLPANE